MEPDASNASYFFAAAALTGGRVRVRGLSLASAQGDVHFVDVLEKMGCRVEAGQDFIEVRGPKRLRGIDVDLNASSHPPAPLRFYQAMGSAQEVFEQRGNRTLSVAFEASPSKRIVAFV